MIFPEEFIKRIETQKYIDPASLLKSLEEPSPVSIRINPAKWIKKPEGSEPIQWCSTGFYLPSRPSFTLDPLFHSGCYYPREASGMFIEQVFNQVVRPGGDLRVLDLCAAPGGKSTHLSDMIGEKGLLVANEVIKSRSLVLAETVAKWGRGNTLVTQNDPSAFRKLNGYFDIIMVDAPCSGEGMFRDITAVREWSVENARLCGERQKRIISDVWPSLKENGLLVYSTCTFNPGENEENIRWLTQNNHAECLRLDIRRFEGVTEIDFEGIYGYGFYPGRINGEGFFISVIRKTGAEGSMQFRDKRKSEFNPDKNDMAVAGRWMTADPGKLIKRGEELVMLACPVEEFMQLLKNLNIISGGTRFAVRKKNDYLPSHELSLSQNIRKGAFPSQETTYRDALFYLKRENIMLPGLHEGWNLLTFRGVNIGFVKNIGKRINNYYPVEWRIRMNIPEQGKENIIRWEDEQ